MAEIHESEWTLDAFKHREEERRQNERASATTDVAEAIRDVADIRPPSGDATLGNNWLAQAFRRRQEEQRAKEILNNARSRDWERAAVSKENPVDDWLIAGFKRHEEEQRHMAQVASALDAASNPDIKTISPISDARSLVAIQNTAIAPRKERPRVDRRLISIGGLIVVAGLFSVLALRTALFAPPKSPALVKAPPTPTKGVANPREGAPTEAERAPSETSAGATPSVQTPANIQKQSVAIPEGQQKPASGAPAVGDGNKPEVAPPMATEGKSTTEPPTVDPAKSRETAEPGKDQNASEAKQPTADKKTKAAKAKSSAGGHSSARPNPFSTFLTRATNSVRKFFGKLGQNGDRSGR